MGKEVSKMEEKQERQEKKPFVELDLIKGEKLYEVTFQPAGYADSSAHTATNHSLPFSSTFLFPMPHRKR